MAQVNYEAFKKFNDNAGQGRQENKNFNSQRVGYFGLKDDGDTAIVRFNIKSLEDPSLAVQSIHWVTTAEGKHRVVGCLRSDPAEDFNHCPLCASGEKPRYRIVLQLLEYKQDDNGNTVAVPVTWDQPARFRETLKSYLLEYGDLRNYVFKITRQGKKGDSQTKYSIIPGNQNIYKEEVFKKDFSAFDNFDINTRILNLSYEELSNFVDTGNLPTTNNPQTQPEYNLKTSTSTNTEFTTFEPVQAPTPTSPLRSSGPIRSTFTGNTNPNSNPETPAPRRYTY